MARKYHPCLFCKGPVKEEKVTVDYRWGKDFIVVLKDVPAGVCEVIPPPLF
ncbi:MAG: YgiT-type zinc finger protein [Nitrospirae bacterium]|nr:YgiT-type zinc finger protein [Nitrospirota bacterium]